VKLKKCDCYNGN